MRDAADGTSEYDVLDAQYQAALQAAGLTEESANALFGQLDGMQAQLQTAQAQYTQLSELVTAKNSLEE